MKTLLIVHHSMTGGTRQMAEAAAAGAAAASSANELHVDWRRADEADADAVLAADGFIFATPEYLAAMSGSMKGFFDRTYYAALDRVDGLPFATLVCAGSDGQSASRQIERIATGWRLKAIAPALIVCTHAQTPAAILGPKTLAPSDLQRCSELGAAMAAGLVLGVF